MNNFKETRESKRFSEYTQSCPKDNLPSTISTGNVQLRNKNRDNTIFDKRRKFIPSIQEHDQPSILELLSLLRFSVEQEPQNLVSAQNCLQSIRTHISSGMHWDILFVTVYLTQGGTENIKAGLKANLLQQVVSLISPEFPLVIVVCLLFHLSVFISPSDGMSFIALWFR